MKRVAALLLLMGLLVGCATPVRQPLAELLALRVQTDVVQVVDTRTLHRSIDRSEHGIGHRGGYRRAVVLYDHRRSCDTRARPRLRCGAKVEVFKDAEAAKRRLDGLIERAAESGRRTTEYDCVSGPVLFRVSGRFDTQQAADYLEAFGASSEAIPDYLPVEGKVRCLRLGRSLQNLR